MSNSIRRLFSAPVFEDENENHDSFLSNFITFAYFMVTLLIVAFAGSADAPQTASRQRCRARLSKEL
ncbi:MAG: hypothetical protein IPG44_20445 [Anaerolineales bacterium]|nr:hypothetical protein [Anaerolineales bacterium]